MPRKKTNLKTGVGGKFDPALATAFLTLAKSQGVSMHEGLRRVMVDAVNRGRLPGIDILALEQREHQKFGPATPVYDGDGEPSKVSRQGPPSHAE